MEMICYIWQLLLVLIDWILPLTTPADVKGCVSITQVRIEQASNKQTQLKKEKLKKQILRALFFL